MYTSRQGFTPEGALTYGLSGVFPPRVCSRDGLGDAETETDCPQPVPGAERDALRNRIKDWTSPWQVDHFAEGHPDLKAIYNDITRRLSGLEPRAKLLRCSKDARDRANNWIGQLEDLCRRVKSDGVHCSGYTRVPSAFSYTVFRGPTYTIRSSSDPAVRQAQAAFAGRGPAVVVAPVTSAPPGSVVVGGVVYASSAEATAAERVQQAAQTPSGVPSPAAPPATGAPGAGAPVLAPPAMPGIPENIAGIPTQYFLYGALAFLAFRMLGGK